MALCEIREAFRHAVPGGYFSPPEVHGLEVPCALTATQSAPLRGLEHGNHRDGAELRSFALCAGHLRALQELDHRLRAAGWASAFHGPLVPVDLGGSQSRPPG